LEKIISDLYEEQKVVLDISTAKMWHLSWASGNYFNSIFLRKRYKDWLNAVEVLFVSEHMIL
jgi:hypothetical protein